MKMGGMISVEITGQRRRSDLPQGGLEVPCIMTLEHKEEHMIKKAKQLLEDKGFSEASVTKQAAGTGESTQRSRKRKAEDKVGKGKNRRSQT